MEAGPTSTRRNGGNALTRTVKVGLGTGNEEQKREKLMLVAQLQQQIGGALGWIGPSQAYSLFEDLAKRRWASICPRNTLWFPQSPEFQQAMQQRGQGPATPLAEAEQSKASLPCRSKTTAGAVKQQIDGLKLQFENAQPTRTE